MGKKEFAAVVFNPEHKTYVVNIASLSSTPLAFLNVHPSHRSQVSGLIAEEALKKVSAEYSDFVDVFSPDLASKLPEHTGINDHAIELVDGQQPPYGPIYSLEVMELETLKAYIETNLVNEFIRPSKSPAGTPILFDRKSDGSLRLCVMWCPQKASAWRTKESRQSSSGLSPSQYETSKCFSDSRIFIIDSSRDSVG